MLKKLPVIYGKITGMSPLKIAFQQFINGITKKNLIDLSHLGYRRRNTNVEKKDFLIFFYKKLKATDRYMA
jgi:hypothetical protein